MDNLARLRIRLTKNGVTPDDAILTDCLESAKAAILNRRFPYGNIPDELEPRYADLQYRCALSIYLKSGADFETAHTENGISRSWSSEGIPEELLSEVTPYCGVSR